jgi:hypothetical protein
MRNRHDRTLASYDEAVANKTGATETVSAQKFSVVAGEAACATS